MRQQILIGDQFSYDINRDEVKCSDCHAAAVSLEGIKHQQWCPIFGKKLTTVPLTLTSYRTYTHPLSDPELQKSIKEFEETQCPDIAQ